MNVCYNIYLGGGHIPDGGQGDLSGPGQVSLGLALGLQGTEQYVLELISVGSE